MSWHYRSPQSFPALFTMSLQKAAQYPDNFVMISAAPTRAEIDKQAEQFRWFKWCIRQNVTASRSLANILDDHDVRARIKEDDLGFILFIIARPTKLSEFIRLNPQLAEEVCQEVQ